VWVVFIWLHLSLLILFSIFLYFALAKRIHIQIVHDLMLCLILNIIKIIINCTQDLPLQTNSI
jgi:hypothetical protein